MAFDQAIAERVIERIHDGKSLRTAAVEVGVKVPTFLLWADQNPSISERYARAIAERAEVHAERIERVVDQVESKQLAPDQGRVMIDALKWTASKLNPKRYGDRVQVDADLRVQITVNDPFAPLPATAHVLGTPALAAHVAEAPGTPQLRVTESAGTGSHLLPAPEHNGPREYRQVPVTSQNSPQQSAGTGNTPTDVPRGERISARTGKPVRKYTRSPV